MQEKSSTHTKSMLPTQNKKEADNTVTKPTSSSISNHKESRTNTQKVLQTNGSTPTAAITANMDTAPSSSGVMVPPTTTNGVPSISKTISNRKINKVVIPPNKKDTRKIFVGGLGRDVTTETFQNFFEQYGKILDAIVMVDRETQRGRGFGFVTFEDPEVARRVLASDEGGAKDGSTGKINIFGRLCEVKPSEPKRAYFSSGDGNGHGHGRKGYNSSSNHGGYHGSRSVSGRHFGGTRSTGSSEESSKGNIPDQVQFHNGNNKDMNNANGYAYSVGSSGGDEAANANSVPNHNVHGYHQQQPPYNVPPASPHFYPMPPYFPGGGVNEMSYFPMNANVAGAGAYYPTYDHMYEYNPYAYYPPPPGGAPVPMVPAQYYAADYGYGYPPESGGETNGPVGMKESESVAQHQE